MTTQYIAIATNGVWYNNGITILVTEAYDTEKQAVLDLFDKFVSNRYFEDMGNKQNLNTIADLIAMVCSNYPEFTNDWTISLNQIKVIIPTKHIAVATNKSSYQTIISAAYDTEKSAVLDLFDKWISEHLIDIDIEIRNTIHTITDLTEYISEEWIISLNQIMVRDK